MTLPQHWPTLCMAARLAPPACGQRAYLGRSAVRFYPSKLMRCSATGIWMSTEVAERDCVQAWLDVRLSDAEAARLWATRPQ